MYLAGPRAWPTAERHALRYARGRVLDVGCGAGRVALELQRRGVGVVGLDASTEAARAASLRGVGEVWPERLEDVGERLGAFETLVLFGNNVGIFESPEGVRAGFAWLATHCAPGARVLAESTSPHFAGAPGLDRRYVRHNVERGLAPGRLRVRYHYDGRVGPWFTWVFLAVRELRAALGGTGWRVEHVVRSGVGDPYVAVLTLEAPGTRR
ncbi:MAG TPA: methyltransferase domain-containing protein [Acidimicrobiales bacterium]|nr:methyltransferase domain-containing protein [Acidimicrobiales bacterium]